MKTTLATCLLAVTTPINAAGCFSGASVLIYVKAFGINTGSISCKGLRGYFATGQTPKDPSDPAQAYLAQVEAQGKCSSSSGCTALCAVELAEDPFEALNTLLGEQQASCEAFGGTYKSNIL